MTFNSDISTFLKALHKDFSSNVNGKLKTSKNSLLPKSNWKTGKNCQNQLFQNSYSNLGGEEVLYSIKIAESL